MRDCCDTGPAYEVTVDAIFTAWKLRCDDNNRRPGSKQQFGKMDLSRGLVLDGYPATTLQGQDLAQMIREMKFMPLVLQMTLPDDLVRKRATKGGRDSDSPEIINQRLKDYHREFDNASIYFPNAKIVKIDASHADADAWKAAQAALDAQGIKPVGQ